MVYPQTKANHHENFDNSHANQISAFRQTSKPQSSVCLFVERSSCSDCSLHNACDVDCFRTITLNCCHQKCLAISGSNFPSINTNNILQGFPERLAHAWLVPRSTKKSPSRITTSSSSRTNVISPSNTNA